MRRIFKYAELTVSDIEAHFGFSTSYAEADTLLLSVSIPNQAYLLLFAINKEGHVMVKEERDGMLFQAVIQYQNFVDGSRHSVYFERLGNETTFIVDQEEIQLSGSISDTKSTTPIKDPAVGEVFVAGVSDAVPELLRFKRFKGCLSSKLRAEGSVLSNCKTLTRLCLCFQILLLKLVRLKRVHWKSTWGSGRRRRTPFLMERSLMESSWGLVLPSHPFDVRPYQWTRHREI
jgi:hypothetical protein